MTTLVPDVEVQQPETSNPENPAQVSIPSPVGLRCQHRFANGKQCRQSGLPSQAGLCSHHFRLSNPSVVFPCTPNDSADLSADLLPHGAEFSSAEDVREYLTRLLILMTKGCVSPRRAAVLAYVTNQLLHSHVVAEKEADDQPQQIIFDLPRPQRD